MKTLILTILSFSVVCFNCMSQSKYSVMKVPISISEKYRDFYPQPKSNKKIFYLDTVVPKENKNKDYTEIIQKVIDVNSYIVMPNYPVYINKNGLKISSDKTIYFQKISQIIFKGPADSRESDILKVYKAKNVKIYNPNIVGSKFQNEKQWGEWSAGIAILGSDNVEIYNAYISETYGDGIILADQSRNIIIYGGWIDQARRDGISITSGINVSISNLTISNTTGTLPMCGIQIEPDWPTDNLENIVIRNVIGFNNGNATINTNVGPMNSNEKEYGKRISITQENITDYYSTFAIGFVMNADNSKYTPAGIIRVKNIKSFSSKNFMWKDGGKSNVIIKATSLTDKNGKTILLD
ncbi:MAG: hypothetical protein BGO33_04260 [Bacteroidia bacterium 43-41]|nr:MAG: hypothetical protein BGO33_04260 [Bacteroidia bacterium 43-41]